MVRTEQCLQVIQQLFAAEYFSMPRINCCRFELLQFSKGASQLDWTVVNRREYQVSFAATTQDRISRDQTPGRFMKKAQAVRTMPWRMNCQPAWKAS